MVYLLVILVLIVFLLTFKLLEIRGKLTEMHQQVLRQSAYFQSTQKWCLRIISKSVNSAEIINGLEDFIKEKDIGKRYHKDMNFTMDDPEYVEGLMAKWIVDELNSHS